MAPAVVSHYDATPVIDIYGAVEGTDLGYIAAQINKLVAETQHSLPRGSQVTVRGQVKTMTDSFTGLLVGLAGAIVLVYLLIVVNFQSWQDPFIIITALPAALGRHRLDAVPHPHAGERAGPDRCHHVHGRRHRQQRAGDLASRASA